MANKIQIIIVKQKHSKNLLQGYLNNLTRKYKVKPESKNPFKEKVGRKKL